MVYLAVDMNVQDIVVSVFKEESIDDAQKRVVEYLSVVMSVAPNVPSLARHAQTSVKPNANTVNVEGHAVSLASLVVISANGSVDT